MVTPYRRISAWSDENTIYLRNKRLSFLFPTDGKIVLASGFPYRPEGFLV
tara:strand:+ start:51887 stop:52036 length:150 start_codon:yes stop_codon:yes gene_type:complete